MLHLSSSMRNFVFFIATSSALLNNQTSLSAAKKASTGESKTTEKSKKKLAPVAYSNIETIQLVTALARFPLAYLASFHPRPHSTGATVIRVLRDSVRIINQSISIYTNDYKESYSAYIPLSYDVYNLGTNFTELLQKTSKEQDARLEKILSKNPELTEALSKINTVGKALFPLIETYTAYKLVGNLDKQSRLKLQVLHSLSRTLAELLDSKYQSTKAKVIAALLVANIVTAYLDLCPQADKTKKSKEKSKKKEEEKKDTSGLDHKHLPKDDKAEVDDKEASDDEQEIKRPVADVEIEDVSDGELLGFDDEKGEEIFPAPQPGEDIEPNIDGEQLEDGEKIEEISPAPQPLDKNFDSKSLGSKSDKNSNSEWKTIRECRANGVPIEEADYFSVIKENVAEESEEETEKIETENPIRAQQEAKKLADQQTEALAAQQLLAQQQVAAQARQNALNTLKIQNLLPEGAINVHARAQIHQRGLIEGSPEHNAIIAARDHLLALLPS